ncbi:MAG: ABC transporter permease [Alphaproteobacteria bacterium]|nr:ABC transporter permease [Alphaproteobacteria bacterium]
MTAMLRVGAFRLLCALILIFLAAPIFAIIPTSFSSGEYFVYPLPGYSGRWYAEVVRDPTWLRALETSLIVGSASAALATLLGTTAALGLSRTRSRWAPVIVAALISPMITPIVIVAVSLFYAYAAVGLVGGLAGLILSHATLGLPFVTITVLATLKTYNTTLDRAAESLGAGAVRIFFTVTLPLIAPGVISGALFAFAVSLDEVVVTLFLASPEYTTLPREIFSGLRQSISPAVVAVSTITIGMSCLLMAVVALTARAAKRLR